MNKKDKFDILVNYAQKHGFRYNAHVLIIDDNIAFKSHYPTIFTKEFLIALFGENNNYWRTLAHQCLDIGLDMGDTVDYLYQEFNKQKEQNGEQQKNS